MQDYGNSETDDRDDGAGAMEAICEPVCPTHHKLTTD